MQTAIVPVSLPKQAILPEANVRAGRRGQPLTYDILHCGARRSGPLARS
ncbi:MAG: hypothetical protein QOF94_2293 [Acidobacteriaceae bacterium]